MIKNIHSGQALGLLTLTLLLGCVSEKRLMQQTPVATIANRLPPIETMTDPGPLANTDGADPDDAQRIFRNEIRQNIAEPTDSAAFGYARLTVTKAAARRTNKGLQYFQFLTLMTPSLLGLPLETYKTDVTAEVQITDVTGKILGTYTGTGHSNVRVAMYYGYSQRTAPRLSDLIALRSALAQIRPQLDSAAGRLRPLLLAGGHMDATPAEPAARR